MPTAHTATNVGPISHLKPLHWCFPQPWGRAHVPEQQCQEGPQFVVSEATRSPNATGSVVTAESPRCWAEEHTTAPSHMRPSPGNSAQGWLSSPWLTGKGK